MRTDACHRRKSLRALTTHSPRSALAWLPDGAPKRATRRTPGRRSPRLARSTTDTGFLGARFWGQVRGSSGRLKVLQGKGGTSGETSQIAGKARYQAPFPGHIAAGRILHGKEGVDGSSPSEGLADPHECRGSGIGGRGLGSRWPVMETIWKRASLRRSTDGRDECSARDAGTRVRVTSHQPPCGERRGRPVPTPPRWPACGWSPRPACPWSTCIPPCASSSARAGGLPAHASTGWRWTGGLPRDSARPRRPGTPRSRSSARPVTPPAP
jgi:hypothetical protein